MAIPSYQRSEKQPTLDYLEKIGAPKERVFVFVQTVSDFKAYQKHSNRANIVLAPAAGIAEARNNIVERFRDTNNVLMMDDDISTLSRLTADKLVPITTGEEFTDTVNRMFGVAKKYGAYLFGIYPVHNSFFMSRNISTAVTVNTVLGFVKGHSLKFDESYRAKEDIELCGRIINSGGKVLRYNFLAPNAKHRTNAGGCHDTWASAENRIAVDRLCETYPDIFARHCNKPDEVRVIYKDTKIELSKKG